jgi:membrane protein DedA with SNARE-associated domain
LVSNILHSLLSLPGWQVYLLVGVLVFGEAAFLLGFVLPGETAVILGGVSASLGHASVEIVAAIAVVAAIVGDSTGYEVGRLAGPRLLDLKPIRKRRRAFDAAETQLRRWGGWAVFVGRFTAFLRAVIPGLSGMSRMHYPKFLLANATGGTIWAIGYTILGYVLGSAYQKAERYSTDASAILLAVLVVVVVGLKVREHRRMHRLEQQDATEEGVSPDDGPETVESVPLAANPAADPADPPGPPSEPESTGGTSGPAGDTADEQPPSRVPGRP